MRRNNILIIITSFMMIANITSGKELEVIGNNTITLADVGAFLAIVWLGPFVLVGVLWVILKLFVFGR